MSDKHNHRCINCGLEELELKLEVFISLDDLLSESTVDLLYERVVQVECMTCRVQEEPNMSVTDWLKERET